MIGRNDRHEPEMEVGRVVSSAGSGAALAREREVENRALALGKNFQRPFAANGDPASVNLNQTVLLQSRQRP